MIFLLDLTISDKPHNFQPFEHLGTKLESVLPLIEFDMGV